MKAQSFTEHSFHAQDGLRLYYRNYGDHRSSSPPLLCLAGLTRNSKDFHDLACRYASDRRVITFDYRGRGRSAYDSNPDNYQPPVYINDILHLLAVTHTHRVVILGTSMGGLMAMAMTAAMPTVLAGVILNDVGPEISPAGRNRIAGYVGTEVRVASYEQAADMWRRHYAGAYPRLTDEGWLKLARASFTEAESGDGLRQDYDVNIAVNLRKDSKTALPDLWPLFRGLRNVPVLAFRGALSDILSTDTFVRMKREHAGMIAVTVPEVGHVPMLDEPEAVTALDAFLAGL